LLKRLSGLSRTALDKTRRLLGTSTQKSDTPSDSVGDGAANADAVTDKSPPSLNSSSEAQGHASGPNSEAKKNPSHGRSRGGSRKRGQNKANKSASASPDTARSQGKQPLIVPAGEHSVTRKSIGRSALKVLDKLHEAGHSAYLVGGGVRDALVGLKPKDFDVATDASPETIRALFRNSRIIGRRFRLVHVVYGREIIEVATFRAAHNTGEGGEIGAAGRIVRDNVFGTIEEDAYRRDFSVNALYYNIADGSVVDYVGGLTDLDKGIFKLIGEPKTRCEEDPVRVLRAVRLAAKLKFDIEPSTLTAMRSTSSELSATPPPRLFEEVLKLFQGGYALRSFHSVREHDLLTYLFPMLDRRLKQGDEKLVSMLDAALANTDKRVAQGKPITPAYLLAFMLWPDVEERAKAECQNGSTINDALFTAADSVLATQLRIISIPRRFSGPMKEIWQMQPRLERLKGGRALKLIEDRRFRAAYDFLCLRSTIDERLKDSAAWWTKVQTLDEEGRADAAAKRPTVDGIWPDKGNRGKAPSGAASDDATAAGSSDKPPAKKRRRRRRKPAGGAGPSSDA
jgi:poly(A) polymerase